MLSALPLVLWQSSSEVTLILSAKMVTILGRYLGTHQGLISLIHYNTFLHATILHCSLMSQHVANDNSFTVAVCKMMSDKVSCVLSTFCFCFLVLINNSWSKITVPEKCSLFHQPFHTLLISTYNFLMGNISGVLNTSEFLPLFHRMLQQRLQEN